jgi:hypothetical protein
LASSHWQLAEVLTEQRSRIVAALGFNWDEQC